MSFSKKDALAIVFRCADQYRNELVNHSLLLVCRKKPEYIYALELTFDASNFQHLTGLQTNHSIISPTDFFERCITRRLKEEDFSFAPDGTTQLKLQVLPKLLQKNLSANMVGDYNGKNPKLITDKLAGGIQGCMGFVKISSGRYVPNTVLQGRTDDFSEKTDRILLIYRKKSTEKEFKEIVHIAKKVDWRLIKLPEEYSDLPMPF